ncbi:hypothetical protein SUNI508_05100 [Seiridium unicorne]|uniref:Uncharacterized protein n=1 Tax=Seiridium unicorne TaxID=138068 RepID=A0ABR2V5A8_9PEZI
MTTIANDGLSAVSSTPPTRCPSTRSSTSKPMPSTPDSGKLYVETIAPTYQMKRNIMVNVYMTQGPRTNYMFLPYKVLLWGSLGSSLYMMGRKVCGYNTWFGKE